MTALTSTQLLVSVASIIGIIVTIVGGQMFWMYRAISAKFDGQTARLDDLKADMRVVQSTLMIKPADPTLPPTITT